MLFFVTEYNNSGCLALNITGVTEVIDERG